MNERAGIMIEITKGIHKGKFGIARNNKQDESFRRIEKLLVELYEDCLCQKRVMDGEKKVVTLIQIAFCKMIGYID